MNNRKRIISPMKCKSDNSPKKQMLVKINPKVRNCQENYQHFLQEDLNFDFDEFDTIVNNVIEKRFTLDLSKLTRCIVEKCERNNSTPDLILEVREDICENKENINSGYTIVKCHLQEIWSQTTINIHDVLSLKGEWDDKLNAFKINNQQGFCITLPDILIPCTNVINSLFCQRKSVLQNYFKVGDQSCKLMVIGSLVHDIYQHVLSEGLKCYGDIYAASQRILQSRRVAFILYSNKLTLEEVKVEINLFIPKIVKFVEEYIDGETTIIQPDTFKDQICEIQDIEENVWVPQLGLKGRIDVTVRIQRRLNKASLSVIPLELKTGRASFSFEHKGQLILYQMMLNAMGRQTDSGLLLYLREGIMKEIVSSRNEERDLITRRNELSYYMSGKEKLLETAPDGKYIQSLVLPDPISHHSACSSCDYATVCCSFARTDPNLNLYQGHPLRKVIYNVTNHLEPEDYEYFLHWSGLLALEDQEAKNFNHLRSLCTHTPEMRQDEGRAIINLKLTGSVSVVDSRFLHVFIKSNNVDLNFSEFSVGEYVIVSTKKRLAITAGIIVELFKNSISINLERNLSESYSLMEFIVDKHESQMNCVFNYTNLSMLIDSSDRATELRSVIISKRKPTLIENSDGIPSEGIELMNELNDLQQSAISKSLQTDSFFLIKGLPGTGKTKTLEYLIAILNLMQKTVLITSHTHTAVDNIMIRLKKYKFKMLRLGSETRLNSELHEYSEQVLLKDCNTEKEINECYQKFSIVGVTCLGASHSIFQHRKFDYCIVDEATQVFQPTILRPLFFGYKFILVGDPNQLPPLVRSKQARSRGADESLFHRLDSEAASVTLVVQYRMNKTIMDLANKLTYEGALEAGSNEVRMNILKIKLPTDLNQMRWLVRILHSNVDVSAYLINTLDCSKRSSNFQIGQQHDAYAVIETMTNEIKDATNEKVISSRMLKYCNYCEAAVILKILKTLLSNGCTGDRIGIIAPYRAQVELLRKLVGQQNNCSKTQSNPIDFSNIEVNTVDQYQGRDKDVIIYSCTKTGPIIGQQVDCGRELEILEDKRRLTVAITRAKQKLFIIGDMECLHQYTPFRALFSYIPSVSQISLTDGKLGFQWDTIMEELKETMLFE